MKYLWIAIALGLLLVTACSSSKKSKGAVCISQAECGDDSICTEGQCATLCSTLVCGEGKLCIQLSGGDPRCVPDPEYSPDVRQPDLSTEDTTVLDKSSEEINEPVDLSQDEGQQPDTSWVKAACGTLPEGQEKVPYTGQLDVGAGASFTVTIQGLPNGLTADDNGKISGTVNSPGTANIKVIVQNSKSGDKATADCQIVIKATPIELSCGTIPVGIIDKVFPTHEGFSKNTKNARGNPKFTVTGLPAGLTATEVGGIISGTPTESASNKSITVSVVDGLGTTASTTCTINVVTSLKLKDTLPGALSKSANGCFHYLQMGQSYDIKQWVEGGTDNGQGTKYSLNTTLGGVAPEGTTLQDGVLKLPAAGIAGTWGFHIDVERGPEAVNVAVGVVVVAQPAGSLKLRMGNDASIDKIPELTIGQSFNMKLFMENGPAYDCNEITTDNWDCKAWYALHFEPNWKEIFGPRGDCGGQCGNDQTCFFQTSKAQCIDVDATKCTGCSHPQASCVDPDGDGTYECAIGNFVIGNVSAPPPATGGTPSTYPFTITQPLGIAQNWSIPASLPQIKGQCIWFAINWWICHSPNKSCQSDLFGSPSLKTTTIWSIKIPN